MEISMEDFVYAKRPEVKFNQYFDSNFPSHYMLHENVSQNCNWIISRENFWWIGNFWAPVVNINEKFLDFFAAKRVKFSLRSISDKNMHTGIHLNSLSATYQESMRKKTKTAQSRVKSTKRRQRQKRERLLGIHILIPVPFSSAILIAFLAQPTSNSDMKEIITETPAKIVHSFNFWKHSSFMSCS